MAGADATVLVDFVARTAGLSKGAKDAQKATKGIGDNLKGMAGKLALAGGIAGLAALGAAARVGWQELQQGQQVAAQTSAVIKSTGGAAKVTADHVSTLATALMKKSGVDDEAIASGENLLLTFTNIRNEAGKGNDIFDQATRATLDLSKAFGKDMGSSAVLVGKALNDPIKGVTALTRVGVTFTKAQQKQIKALVDSGDVAGAQKVILAELNREVGGSAEAYGKTLSGQVDIAKESLNNMAGDLMQSVLPAVTAATNALIPMIEWLTKHPGAVKVMAAAFAVFTVAMLAFGAATTIAAAAEAAVLLPVIAVIAAIIALIAVAVLLYRNWDRITKFLGDTWNAIKKAASDAVQSIGDAIAQLPGKILAALAAVAAAALKIGAAVVTGIKDGVVKAKDWVGTVVGQIPGKIAALIATILATAKRVGAAIVTGIKDGVIAAKDWVGTVVGQVVGKIAGAISAITSEAKRIGAAIVAGIKDGVVAAKDWVGTVVGQVVGKIAGAISAIQTEANKIGSAIASGIKNGISAAVNWVGQQISSIGGKLAGLLRKIPGAGAVAGLVGHAVPTGLAVPHLAAGGVLNRPTLFLGGEAGREIVTPESLLRQILRDEGAGSTYQLNLTTQRADAADIAYGFRRLELLRTGR
jgi:hypothetical protein